MKIISENASFGGTQGVYSHQSDACACEMTFAVYMPPQAVDGVVPVIWYLSGLTCTHENAMVKAGAQAWAAEHGIAVIFPDTSPRGEGVADDEGYDLGQGAGFYVDATQEPWAQHYQMWTYITEELPKLIFRNFDLNDEAQGIMGHSMGGHGALTMAISLPDQYKSVSAFSPIANPTSGDWGRKQLSAYLGDDENAWGKHDSSLLMAEKGYPGHVMIDQGGADEFYDLLIPGALISAIAGRKQSASVRILEGYDHSYFFVSTFMEDHIAHHADVLHNL
ncbi:MAG: S-formylglutathione hydrolase [Paracoccaceae bacterium]|jgi:S-formylglutathione hydrolase